MFKRTLPCLLLLAMAMGASRHDAWEIVGPGGGGAQFFPAINPQNSNEIFVACDMTGAYVSHDGGSSWRMFNLGGVTRRFVFDPNDARTVYAISGRAVWRSTDAGDTWRLVVPDPATVTGIFQHDDHATNIIASSTGLPGAIDALAADPGDSHVLYAVMRRGTLSGLFVSEDWGKTWKRSADLDGGGRWIYIDAHSPREDRTVYVIGDTSVAVRRDGAWRRGPAPSGVTSFVDATFGVSGGKPILYAASKTAVFVSEDGGASWRESRLPGEASELHAIAASAQHGESAYLSYSKRVAEGERWFGVAKTADFGHTWTLAWKESSKRAAENIHDIWIAQRFGPGWAGYPLSLAVAAADPNLCIATDLGRTMRTRDGGQNWDGVYSMRLDDGSFTSTGLDVTTNYGVYFNPFDR